MTMITAHTGCEDTISNSGESVEKALECGADCLEVDLRIAGGQVILSHDPPDDGDSFTLSHCIDMVRGSKILLNCDLKEKRALPAALALFRERVMEDRIIFTGQYPIDYADRGTHRCFINVENLDPLLKTRGLTPGALDAILKKYGELRRNPVFAGINLNYRLLTDSVAEQFRTAEIPVSCWTVDDPGDIRRMLELEVYNITTRNVLAALRQRRNM